MRKLLSVLLAATLALTLFSGSLTAAVNEPEPPQDPAVSAETEESQEVAAEPVDPAPAEGDEADSPETTVPETENPEEDEVLVPSSLSDKSTWITYKVTGGNIYFDPETQNVVDCDDTVTEAVVPAEINGIAVRMIYNMNGKALKKVVISDGIKAIGPSAFLKCSNLVDIQIPNTVTEIGASAFSGCSSIVEIKLPNSISQISENLFDSCTNLTSVNIPYGVNSIGNYAFFGCLNLKSIEIPDTVSSFGYYAFVASGLENIFIPASVNSIGLTPFRGCSSLASIEVDKNNQTYYSENGVLFTKLGQILKQGLLCYPEGKTDESYTVDSLSIGREAIINNPYLKSLKFTEEFNCQSNSVKNLENLKEVYLPIQTVSTLPFEGCYSITDVFYDGCEQRWNKIKKAASGDHGSLFAAKMHFNDTDHIIDGIELEVGDTQTVAKYEKVNQPTVSYNAYYSARYYYLGKMMVYYPIIGTENYVAVCLDGKEVKLSVHLPGDSDFTVTYYTKDGQFKQINATNPEVTLTDIVPENDMTNTVSVFSNSIRLIFSVYSSGISISYSSYGGTTSSLTNYGFAPLSTVIPFGSKNLPFGGSLSDYEAEVMYLCNLSANEVQQVVIGRASFSEGLPHEHTFGNSWKNDAQNHWHVCEKCSQTSSLEPHSFEDGVCTVCGYALPEHVHSFKYGIDTHVHWQYCEACGYTCNVEEHTFENGICKYCGSAKAAGGLNGDMDNDGKITLNDAVLVLKKAMNVKQ